jgi:outer membrane receptor protein involved in Fe transport
MRLSVPLLISCILLAPAFTPSRARAQESAPEEQVEPSATPEPSRPAPATPPKSRPGIEEIVIQAGESDAATDFNAGDSVAAFDASDLEALGAQSVADLAAFTPNLEIVTAGATTPTFFIRGVGLNDFNSNSSGAVAVYQDDVQLNSPALQLGTLFDTEAVNILRGPQGTGPFRNATAGAIKLYSRRPSGNFGAYLSSSYGNYNYKDFEGAVEAPIFEDILTSRFSFRFTERDGFAKNGCGDAPPIEDRPILGNTGSSTSAPWSICGENVPREGSPVIPGTFPPTFNDGRSPIPEGLPSRVNNSGNWAARGILLFQPTLDMEWQLTAQGSRRDELSRLGQSYGTGGVAYDPDCLEALGPDSRRRDWNTCRVVGVLGGLDEELYTPQEVLDRRWALNPCVDSEGNNNGECGSSYERVLANAIAMQSVASELAADLDTDPHHGDYDRVGPTTNDIWGVSLKGDMVLGGVTLSSVSGYYTYDRLIDIDLDFSPNVLFEIETDDEGWQFTQDLSVSGEISEEIPLRWTLGGFYLMEELDIAVTNHFQPLFAELAIADRQYVQSLWSAAGYGSFEWDFWNDFTLDGGVRYNWERKQMDYHLLRGTNATDILEEGTWSHPTGTIRLTYRFREDTHAYWKYTHGWKGAHYNATTSEDQGVTPTDPETIDAFEVGLRGSWFDGRLGASFAVFHYNYDNYQIFTAQQQFGAQPEFVILNARSAEVYGSELDLVARPLPGMYLQARLAWLESQFLDYSQNQVDQIAIGNDSIAVVNEIQNSGNPLLNSPKYKVSLTAEQTLPLGRFGSLTARWDGAWTDDTNYDATDGLGIPNFEGVQFLPEGTIGQRAFWLHNLRLGYRTPGGNLEVAGWIRNLTDQVYKTFAFDGSRFNQTTIYFVGDPRTYGLTVTATF